MTLCEDDVSQCPLFGTMSSDERQHVQQLAEYLTFAKGRTIFRERDEVPQGLWMLHRGKCQVVKELAGGRGTANDTFRTGSHLWRDVVFRSVTAFGHDSSRR